MKAHTDLEQSKRLAEFLPIESADCYWDYDEMQKFHRISWFKDGYNKESQLMLNENNVCAWSLAALLNILPSATLDTSNDHYGRFRCLQRCTEWHVNPVDACVAMIEKLHELKKL